MGLRPAPIGNLWFAEFQGDNIGEINPTTDVITEFTVPTADDGPQQIAAGPNNTLWFGAVHSVGEVQLGPSVGTAGTTDQLHSSANPSVVGQAVTFTATVAAVSGNQAPTGTVTFTIDGHAQTSVTLSVVNDSDQATFETSTLTAGTHSVTATYSGDSAFAPGSDHTPHADGRRRDDDDAAVVGQSGDGRPVRDDYRDGDK